MTRRAGISSSAAGADPVSISDSRADAEARPSSRPDSAFVAER
ncbi:hypothetical protein [Microbacterium sp. KHB019]